mgnify:CR=1 FL=1
MTDPLRVILANDAELIIQGLRGLLGPYSDRVEVVATATGDPDIVQEALIDTDADVMLIDAFGRTGAGIDAEHRRNERRRPPVHGQGVPATQPFAIPGLNFRGFRLLRAGGEKAEQTLLLQDVQDSGIFPLIDQSRSMETGAQALRAHWLPAIDR